MSENLIHPDDSQVIWKEYRSKLGKRFRVGYPMETFINNTEVIEMNIEGNGKKIDFGISVKWPVGDNSWKNVDANVNNVAAISRYKLYPDGSGYTLYFSNNEHYNYYFYDETGDSYHVNTWRNGDHFVDFHSSKPTIVFISGS